MSETTQEDLLRIEVARLKDEIAHLKSWAGKRMEWPDHDAMERDLNEQAAPKPKRCPHCGKEMPLRD